jgi:hypothetical protein
LPVNLELRHVAPLRAANVLAILQAAMMALFSIPMLLMFSTMPMPDGPEAQGMGPPFAAFRWLILAYPILGAIVGWIAGLVGAFVYNLVAAYFGGLRLEFLHMDR